MKEWMDAPPYRPPHRLERVSEDVCAASELLEVLWGRGQEAAPPTVSTSQLRALLVIEKQEGSNLRSLGEALGSRAPSVCGSATGWRPWASSSGTRARRAVVRSSCG